MISRDEQRAGGEESLSGLDPSPCDALGPFRFANQEWPQDR